MEQVRCNLCGGNKPKPYITSIDRFSGKEFTLSRCSQCGLIYLTPRPTLAELDQYYPDEYEAYICNNQPGKYFGLNDRKSALSINLKFIENFHPKRGRLLDIGCATGDFLHIAQIHGWQVLGIEIIEKAAKIARQQYKLEVLSTSLESSVLEQKYFDVITMWDVLEHLPDPAIAMQIIHDRLQPGGMVFLSIPNLDSFDRKIFGSNWIGWDPPRHFTLFTQHTLEDLLKNSGFKVITRKCLSGGKGTFQLSLDKYLQSRQSLKWVKQFYPVINLILWPYRQFSYRTLHGPILNYAVMKI